MFDYQPFKKKFEKSVQKVVRIILSSAYLLYLCIRNRETNGPFARERR